MATATATAPASAPTALPLVGKKMMSKLGAMPNESAAAGVSAFARKQMEKMGWSAGKGLGKQEQGMVTHIKAKKREELAGVGSEKQGAEEQKNQWWYNVYDKLADKIQIAADSDTDVDADADAKKTKKKKKKKSSKSDRKRKRSGDDAGKFRVPTDEELFAATGGKLFGRRAYGSCQGKLKRDALHVAGRLKPSAAEDAAPADSTSVESAESEDGAAKKARKSKKDKRKKKKDKKETTEEEEQSGGKTVESDA